MFLCAKTASAATAALGFAGYVLNSLGQTESVGLIPLGLAVVLALTVLVLCGIRLSNAANIAIVSLTLASLTFFVLAGLPSAWRAGRENLTPFFAPAANGAAPIAGFLEASALMFIAYTGYGRIATLGEEVHDPQRTIPLAIITALLVTMALYVSVGLVAVAAVGAEQFAAGTRGAAPLEFAARQFAVRGASTVVAIGAVTAMLGVLLNLILGLSRVLLAMGRRRDAPSFFGKIRERTATPSFAVLAVGAAIAALVLIGNIKTTWSFSAFTVLIYYAITNLAALRLKAEERLYSRFIPWAGLVACLFLAFWVEARIWIVGLALIAAGLVWHFIATKLSPEK
jgi:APA family basic amino acid/polyamine antiporter